MNLTIQLPQEKEKALERKASLCGHGDVSEYVKSLIEKDLLPSGHRAATGIGEESSASGLVRDYTPEAGRKLVGRGKYAHVPGGSDAFNEEKVYEIAREDRR